MLRPKGCKKDAPVHVTTPWDLIALLTVALWPCPTPSITPLSETKPPTTFCTWLACLPLLYSPTQHYPTRFSAASQLPHHYVNNTISHGGVIIIVA